MPSIQAVLFDFGQVLSLPPGPVPWSKLKHLSALSEEELSAGYWANRDDYDAGIYTGDQYWQLIAGRALPPETLQALKDADVELWTAMNEPMLAWVDALHRAGFRTGILSNMPDAMAEGICAKFDWISNFDHTIWSHALKLRKPQPEIYQAAIAGLGVPAASILFIDDKLENIEAAQASGMQTVQYSDHESFVHEMERKGYCDLLHPAQSDATPV